ncbi:MAG: polymerase beta subunit [Bryobacterales bacterium]|nr:polymerase beta subunit [Bryobacterales bacterium]
MAAKKKTGKESPVTIVLKDSEAVRMVNACEHCIDYDDTRQYLHGICLQYSEKPELTAVATDGHRLALCKVNYVAIECKTGIKLNCILGREAIDWISGIKKCTGATVTLTIDQKAGTAAFELNGHGLTTKLIDLTYPNWRKLWDDAAKGCQKEPTAYFNVQYLNDIAKAAKNMGGNTYSRDRIGLVFSRKDPKTEAMIVETPDNGIHYLLMPRRA